MSVVCGYHEKDLYKCPQSELLSPDMETPDSWIEIIKNNSKTEEEFISSLKKLEKVLKRFGITQQTVDDINEGECIKEAIRRGIEKRNRKDG